MFGANEDRAVAFAKRGVDDRHHFRFIVSPEEAAERLISRPSHPRPDQSDGERSRHPA
jgi:hypothetical protein